MDKPIDLFLEELSSKAPTPGGGGASALIGAVGASLCSMVGNLTTGKKKYAAYEDDIQRILAASASLRDRLCELIEEDAKAFAPLAAAYAIPKDAPGREETLEQALKVAAEVPLSIMRTVAEVIDLTGELMEKGSTLAVSDVAVAAAACRAALSGAVMNVYINTKLMKDRAFADEMNKTANELLEAGTLRCDAVFFSIADRLGGRS